MKQEKETRNKLLASAREEFTEKGYMKASLRNICKNAGVTTGALYFFFQDKEDLFDALVKDTVSEISALMQSHFQEEGAMMQAGEISTQAEAMAVESEDDRDVALGVLHQLYAHREEVLLLLTKSQGTKYENIADQFIEITEKHYRIMAQGMAQAYPSRELDDKFIHWLAHEQIDAFIYAVTHIDDEREAATFIQKMVTYMMAGWYGLFTVGDN